ncbi:MAG: SEL1-like repeat protein [Methylobacterium mesophilicum]|nr:SEL1-like repeat protein [Methylobacterium mesophilicum]
MTSRRSYLDTLNAGRQRRPSFTHERLDRSLDLLDEHVRQMTEALREEDERLAPDESASHEPDSLGRMTREVERARLKQDEAGAAGRIADELREMRDAFNRQSRAPEAAPASPRWNGEERRAGRREAQPSTLSLQDEFERLQAAIRAVGERQQNMGMDALKADLEEVRTSLSQLAHSERTGKGSVASLHVRLDQLEETMRKPNGMDARLEEISRALVASTASLKPLPFDAEPLNRLEAQLASVSRQMAARAEEPSDEIMRRLTQLSERVDELASRANLPLKAVEQLSNQVAIIAAKLDAVPALPDPDFLFKAIEQRFDALSVMLEKRIGSEPERNTLLFRDLEKRLEEVSLKLDAVAAQAPEPRPAHEDILGIIDARFEDFARKLEERAPAGKGETKLIRSLEAQIKVLTEHLSQPGLSRADLEEITPRLDKIEEKIVANHDAVISAAREAAESAVRSLDLSSEDGKAVASTVAGLTDDLKALETLTKRSDERNAKTFEAIHDTLIKIVERLGSLETRRVDVAPDAPSEPAKLTIENTPPLDVIDMGATETAELSSAPMAAEPADEPAEGKTARRSLLGGLSRAFRKSEPASAKQEPAVVVPASVIEETPAVPLDAPLGAAPRNQPIEPNTGGPDLGAIMRRVRDERAGGKGDDADVAKSDFIAAARRAAQAAAAEAETLKRKSGSGTASGGRLSDLLKRRRKSVLMAVGAVMIALAGLQAGNRFLATRELALDSAPTASVPEKALDAMPKIAAAKVFAPAEAKPVAVSAIVAQPATAPRVEPRIEPEAPKPAAMAAVAPVDPENDAIAARIDAAAPVAPVTPAAAEPAATTEAPQTLAVPAEAGPSALREAAEAGDAKALFEVASRLVEGRGMKADPKAAADLMEKAAALGLAPAQYRIGSFLEKGTGRPRDLAGARKWYQQAAEKGNASAMHNLAVLDAMGANGKVDNEAAVRWFTAAAEHGVRDSQFNLGILAAKGVGMPRDLEASYKWFAVVAAQGDADAGAKRDEIGKALSPEALERARTTAELWKAKPVDPEANRVELPETWSDGPTTTAENKPVDMKAAVRTIQMILAKNGYEAGSADGVMGAKTKAAIVQFQKDNDLSPTGEVDQKLVQALIAKK